MQHLDERLGVEQLAAPVPQGVGALLGYAEGARDDVLVPWRDFREEEAEQDVADPHMLGVGSRQEP